MKRKTRAFKEGYSDASANRPKNVGKYVSGSTRESDYNLGYRIGLQDKILKEVSNA